MNVLLIGSGGRESAIAWKLRKSAKLSKLFTSPGNAGTEQFGENVSLDLNNDLELFQFIEEHDIELVIVGPEVPLVEGIHDRILASNLKKVPIVIGPKADGAKLEGSKNFSKEFMLKHDIPTARHQTFNKTNIDEADDFLSTLSAPYVLKADGLAAGKGVLIIDDKHMALKSLSDMINHGQFGEASREVVIEEFLHGIELSVFVLTDGENYKVLPTAKDYKRIGEGDTGLNTGGMGAISPAPSANVEFMNKVEERIINPTIQGLKNEGIDYQGFLFIGLMDVDGDPKVIEYNVRLGDPETEAILPRIETDLMELFSSFKNKSLDQVGLTINNQAACTVMMVSGGYPEKYKKGYPIEGLDMVDDPDILTFHAGTTKIDGETVTNGGRVLSISCIDENLEMALKKTYHAIDNIKFTDRYYRKDIGYEIIKL